MYQQRFSFLAWVALVGIPSMLLDNLEKYIIQFGEINFVLWINVSNKWKKYILVYVSRGCCSPFLDAASWNTHNSNWTNNTLYNLDKYNL